MEKTLKAMVNKLNLDSHFYFAGNVSDRMKLLEYYQNAEIFVLPSFYESSPLVLREAMSCALPVVATNVGGISEIAINNENALLISPNSSIGLETALLKLLNDEKLRYRLGANARYTIKKVCCL
jgi:glycosyltransferase involved in cell wall biosynthesis